MEHAPHRVARSTAQGFIRSKRGFIAFVSATLLGACSDGMHRLGGPGDGEPEPVIALCRGRADLELIDDMEDKLDSIMNVEDRSGFWFAFNDGTSTGVQVPKANAPLYPMEALDPARAGESWYAIRARGSGFTAWGAGIGFDLRSHLPYDASRYSGIAFWARKEPGSTTSIRLSITDANTAPQGGKCEDTEDTSVMNRCYDNFGKDVALTDEWQFYRYLWSDLSQEGFSGVTQPAIVNSKLYGVRFQVKADEQFDLVIDDIAFTCKKN